MKKEFLPPEFTEIVDLYKVKVYNTCLGFVKNVQEAEDLAQEVFIEVYKNLDSFRSESKLPTWIYRIAVNKSLEHIRRQSRQKRNARYVNPEIALNVEGSGFYHPGIRLEQKETASMLFEAIGELVNDQKTAFTLSKINGLSNPEIGEIMKKSVSSVESLIHRAKSNLRKKLEEYYETV